MRNNKILRLLVPLSLVLALLLSGCSQAAGGVNSAPQPDEASSAGESAPESEGAAVSVPEDMYIDRVEMSEEMVIEDEEVAQAGATAALNQMLVPVASGTQVKKNERAIIDYSNTKDGYVMAQFTGATDKRLKAQVSGPTAGLVYTYNLTAGKWETFPLSDGNGQYTVTVYENTTGSKYAQVVSVSFTVAMTDEFAPFLRPNQYVDYSAAPATVAKAAELAGAETDPLKLVQVVYDYVVNNFTYDKQLAATVQSGYLPVLDSVLAARQGICFDYAALMTGMLRSLGVPCKLITGYVPTGAGKMGYHAWISVWSESAGWVEGAVFFDGQAWQRMDPTFASSAHGSAEIMQFIGNGSNYSVKYIY